MNEHQSHSETSSIHSDGGTARAVHMGRNIGKEIVRGGATVTAAAQRGIEQVWTPMFDFRSEVLRAGQTFWRDMMGWPLAGLGPLPGLSSLSALDGASFRPTLDVKETDRAYIVCMEAPGMSAVDLTVQIRGGDLVICGSKSDEHEDGHVGHMVKERRFGTFERSLPIPQGADVSRVQARFEHGVLKIAIPKDEEKSVAVRTVRIEGGMEVGGVEVGV
jgi:HSP20 family protein